MDSAAAAGGSGTNDAPSASTWTWHATYGLFYNPTYAQWARYDHPTGTYQYLPSTETTAVEQTAVGRAGDKEEGELSDDGQPATASAERYDNPRQYAFPSAANDDAPAARPATAFRQEFLRLVCLRSSCLPGEQRVATLSSHQPDGYSIGRDRQIGSELGRIRLREMEVRCVAPLDFCILVACSLIISENIYQQNARDHLL